MKKYFLTLVAIIAIVAVLTGCSNDQDKINLPVAYHIVKSFDTTVYMNSIKTAPRYACNGHMLRQPKLVAIQQIAIPIHFGIDTTVGSTYDKKTGLYEPLPTTSPYNQGSNAVGGSNKVGGIPAWLDDLFWTLVGLILVGMALLALWWLYSKAINALSSNQVISDASATTVSNTTADDVAIMAQLQKTGGHYNRGADGSVSIDIPEQPSFSAIFVDITIVKQKKVKEKE